MKSATSKAIPWRGPLSSRGTFARRAPMNTVPTAFANCCGGRPTNRVASRLTSLPREHFYDAANPGRRASERSSNGWTVRTNRRRIERITLRATGRIEGRTDRRRRAMGAGRQTPRSNGADGRRKTVPITPPDGTRRRSHHPGNGRANPLSKRTSKVVSASRQLATGVGSIWSSAPERRLEHKSPVAPRLPPGCC